MSAASAELGSLYNGAHLVYDVADLRLTVTNMEPYRDEIEQTTIEH